MIFWVLFIFLMPMSRQAGRAGGGYGAGVGSFFCPRAAPTPVFCPAHVSEPSEGAAGSFLVDAILLNSSIPAASSFPQVLPASLHRDLAPPSCQGTGALLYMTVKAGGACY